MAVLDVRGFEHAGLLVADTVAMAQWYGDMFKAGEVLRSGDERPVIFLAFGGGALLELVPTPDSAPGPSGRVHLCLSVPDLDAALAALAERGVTLDRPAFTAFDGSRVAFFRDPEGNLLQIVQRVAGSAVHGAVYDIS